jgi:hypothetical protein
MSANDSEGVLWAVILEMVTALEQSGIPYQIDSSTTLFVHGIDVYIKDVDIMIQVDHFEDAHALVRPYNPPPITDTNGWIQFHIFPQDVDVHFLTTNKMTDLAANTDRVRVTHQDTTFWSLSVDWCRRHTPDDHERAPLIDQYLTERDQSRTP